MKKKKNLLKELLPLVDKVSSEEAVSEREELCCFCLFVYGSRCLWLLLLSL